MTRPVRVVVDRLVLEGLDLAERRRLQTRLEDALRDHASDIHTRAGGRTRVSIPSLTVDLDRGPGRTPHHVGRAIVDGIPPEAAE